MQPKPSLLAATLLAAAGLVQAAPPANIDCADVDAEIARVGEARRVAQAQNESAWKAVVPFVVLARKAGAKATLAEIDKQLAELKAQAERCGSSDGR